MQLCLIVPNLIPSELLLQNHIQYISILCEFPQKKIMRFFKFFFFFFGLIYGFILDRFGCKPLIGDALSYFAFF